MKFRKYCTFPFWFKKTVTLLLIGLAFLVGGLLLVLGIQDGMAAAEKTRGYETTTGSLTQHQVYRTDKDGTTYSLTYTYTVNGRSYQVTTDYGTGAVPKYGTQRKIHYDPDDPQQAYIAGGTSANLLLFMGIFFLGGASAFVVGILLVNGKLKPRKINVIEVVMGSVLAVAGLGMLYLIGGSLSPVDAFRHGGLLILIPCMMAVVGAYVAVRGLFFYKPQD